MVLKYSLFITVRHNGTLNRKTEVMRTGFFRDHARTHAHRHTQSLTHRNRHTHIHTQTHIHTHTLTHAPARRMRFV